MNASSTIFRLLLCPGLLLGGAVAAQAQTVYRAVGPDGKVTFSDTRPADAAKATATTSGGKQAASPDGALPYELRQVIARYPVTLYSGASCAPCNAGRLLLQTRGIPFAEYTVSTNEDIESLSRLGGDNALPFLTIGGQKIKGFSEAEWVQFLNAANYPATSILPANYRNAAAKPLVNVQKPAPAPAQAEAAAAAEEKPLASKPPSAPTPDSSNPLGIKF